jgi:hypothetical protein
VCGLETTRTHRELLPQRAAPIRAGAARYRLLRFGGLVRVDQPVVTWAYRVVLPMWAALYPLFPSDDGGTTGKSRFPAWDGMALVLLACSANLVICANSNVPRV